MVCCESGGGEGTAWTLGPRGPVEPGVTQPHLNMPPDLPTASRLLQRMDLRTMTQSLVTLAEDNMAFFSSQGPGETARRLTGVFAGIREQALGLEPALGRLLSVAHLFDLDTETPANGYRSLVHTARCCLAHLLHKSRYVASNRRSIFFRTSHNLAELEAYLAALTQLRALAYYAQRLLTTNQPGRLFFEGDERVIADFLREYVTLHKGCFYGRCLGFQVSPLPPACPLGPWQRHTVGPTRLSHICVLSHSVVSDSFVTPWAVACQAPLSIGFPQARILEWVATPFSRGSSRFRD